VNEHVVVVVVAVAVVVVVVVEDQNDVVKIDDYQITPFEVYPSALLA
jgi:hypothetical protein